MDIESAPQSDDTYHLYRRHSSAKQDDNESSSEPEKIYLKEQVSESSSESEKSEPIIDMAQSKSESSSSLVTSFHEGDTTSGSEDTTESSSIVSVDRNER